MQKCVFVNMLTIIVIENTKVCFELVRRWPCSSSTHLQSASVRCYLVYTLTSSPLQERHEIK